MSNESFSVFIADPSKTATLNRVWLFGAQDPKSVLY